MHTENSKANVNPNLNPLKIFNYLQLNKYQLLVIIVTSPVPKYYSIK